MAWRSTITQECSLPNLVKILDTTLRDGEQTPGVALMPDEKLKLAKQLDALGVDVIEAGFPMTSEGEREAVTKIAEANLSAEICGLARSIKTDIDAALECGVDSVHTFIATSEIHMTKKLKRSREEVLKLAVEGVEYAKAHGVKVEFSAEDCTRSDFDFVVRVFKAVANAGADRLNVPDTVGVAIPRGMFNLVKKIKNEVKVPVSVHCHNDLGLAVANSLAGVEAGAEQVHATINGLGERAGNASLEELVVGLHTLYGIRTNIRLAEIYKTSQLVSKLTGIALPPTKPIVGDNAFAHESGIHTHGVISSPDTYEPIPPEMVGHIRRIVAGKHAGAHGIDAMLKEMGFSLKGKQLNEVLSRVKGLGDKGRTVTEADLYSIVESVSYALTPEEEKIKLEDLVVVTGNRTTPTATVRIAINGRQYNSSDFGIGPIDAAIKAIRKVVGDVMKFRLVDFRLGAISGGTDALADVTVKLTDDRGRLVSARAVGEDIVMAGVEAIINAANKLFAISAGGKKK